MRSLPLFFLLAAAGQVHAASVGQLGWLAGCWATDGREAGSGEMWMAPAGGTMLGMSRNVKGGKTVDWEFVQIRTQPDGRLAYVVKPHNQPEAAFPLLRMKDSEAVFEAIEHEFPQRILYRRDGARVHARIEGVLEGKPMAIDYPLRRIDCTAGK